MPRRIASSEKRLPAGTSNVRRMRALSTPTLPATEIAPDAQRLGRGAAVVSGLGVERRSLPAASGRHARGRAPRVRRGPTSSERELSIGASCSRPSEERSPGASVAVGSEARGGLEVELVVLAGDLDARSGRELTAQDELGERILEEALDRSLERARSERGIESLSMSSSMASGVMSR